MLPQKAPVIRPDGLPDFSNCIPDNHQAYLSSNTLNFDKDREVDPDAYGVYSVADGKPVTPTAGNTANTSSLFKNVFVSESEKMNASERLLEKSGEIARQKQLKVETTGWGSDPFAGHFREAIKENQENEREMLLARQREFALAEQEKMRIKKEAEAEMKRQRENAEVELARQKEAVRLLGEMGMPLKTGSGAGKTQVQNQGKVGAVGSGSGAAASGVSSLPKFDSPSSREEKATAAQLGLPSFGKTESAGGVGVKSPALPVFKFDFGLDANSKPVGADNSIGAKGAGTVTSHMPSVAPVPGFYAGSSLMGGQSQMNSLSAGGSLGLMGGSHEIPCPYPPDVRYGEYDGPERIVVLAPTISASVRNSQVKVG